MTDNEIIDLYWNRDESAIVHTNLKYGSYCHKIALNVLGVREDAEECVNDTYHQAWRVIPPEKPKIFRAWLGKVVRNISINLWNKNHRKKRYNGMEILLSELEDIATDDTIIQELEAAELGKIIDKWLLSLEKENRVLFVLRYFNGESVKSLSDKFNISQNKMASKMYKLRQELKAVLEKEGVIV